jgi:two-component system sensor histidine kinase CreC
MVGIRTRLFLAFVVFVGLGFYFLVDWLLDDLRPRYLEAMEESMVDSATVLSSIVEQQMKDDAIQVGGLRAAFTSARKKRFSAKIYEMTKHRIAIRVYVTDRDGIVVYDSENGKAEGQDYSRWNDVYLTLRGKYGARSTRSDPDDPRTSFLYVASPIRKGDEIAGVLAVGKAAGSVNMFIQSAQRKIVIGGVLAGLLVIVLGFVTALWITRPINRLIGYAHRVRDGERASLPKLGLSEMRQLGQAFEEMRDALEGKRFVEQYVQTLTHEMKSPLSGVRGAAELLKEEVPAEERARFLENICAETDRMQEVIDRLLQLSSLEGRKELRDVERFSLGDVVTEAVESTKPLADARGVRLQHEGGPSALVEGERFLVRQAIVNLLQNAVDFCTEGDAVDVVLDREGDLAVLSVWDSGPGIPEYALPKVFERFYSLPRPVTGKKSSGLGLAFVREVTLLHRGRASIENLPEGGVVASLRLPTV